MNEQKYYVRLIPTVNVADYLQDDYLIVSSRLYLDCDCDFSPSELRSSVTLKGLSEVADGTFAKDVSYDDSTEIELVGKIIDGYWINPMIELVPVKIGLNMNNMDNKIIKMQVEILDLNKIEQYKEMLKKDSISYYEDFLLDNIVFIEVENKIKTEIEKDSRFEVHMGHIAYH